MFAGLITLLWVALGFPSFAAGASDCSDGNVEYSYVESLPAVADHRYFRISFTDFVSGAPVPGVRLETVHRDVYYSDLNGNVALYDPDLTGERVYFEIEKEGYEYWRSLFRLQGKTFRIEEGGSASIRLIRVGDFPIEEWLTDLDTRLLQMGRTPRPEEYFQIQFIDSETRRGVPMVRLTSEHRDHFSDNHGLIAYFDPDETGRCVHFQVFSHGYSLPEEGIWLEPQPGRKATLSIERTNLAQRLYRITGAGLYRDTLLLGKQTPLANPVFNSGKVMGQDSVLVVRYRNRLQWIWGDTSRPHHRVGNFEGSGAWSELPRNGGLGPGLGVNLNYYVGANGFSRRMAPIGDVGAVWLVDLVNIRDAQGNENLFANFVRVSGWQVLESGIMKFDDNLEIFERVYVDGVDGVPLPSSGSSQRLEIGGQRYVYKGPMVRFLENPANLLDATRYEAYTALQQGSESELDRDEKGNLVYSWKPDTRHITKQMVRDGLILPGEHFGVDNLNKGWDFRSWHSRDPVTGNGVLANYSRMHWNPYRQRFVTIAGQVFGSSFLGELWYAEADTPMGPWVYVRKIVSHEAYSFYNPAYHPFFDEAGGRKIYFEGTYSNFLLATPPTPRYDYNQIMYQLHLDDPHLALPVAVYDVSRGKIPNRFATKKHLARARSGPLSVAFMAPDLPADGTIPIYAHPVARKRRSGAILSRRSWRNRAKPLFYALPPETEDAPITTVPLYQFVHIRNRLDRAYSTDPDWAETNAQPYRRREQPLCLVWKNPIEVPFPVTEYLPDRAGNCCAARNRGRNR